MPPKSKTRRRKPPSSPNNVIFSFQGSFGPPTFGHFMSMYNFALQIIKDYRGHKRLFFMPAAGGSKAHLIGTRLQRKNALLSFCKILKSLFPQEDIEFGVSEIEYDIAGSANRSVGTIHTIRKLVELKTSESDEISLGMGLDNAFQLPYWESIDEYAQHVSKIYVVHRDPTPTEKQNIRLFQVTNADAKRTKAKMYFDITIPSWTKAPFLRFFVDPSKDVQIAPADPNRQALLLENLTQASKTMFNFYGTLPTIVEIKCNPIPPTSSSMMRYFIAKVLTNESVAENKEKVKNIIFGRDFPDMDNVVDETIASYEPIFLGPNSIIKTLPQNEDPVPKGEPSYEEQYLIALPHLSFSKGSKRSSTKSKK